MGLMLVAVLPGWFAGTATAVFAAGLAWCLVQAVRQARRAAYVRLAVCCLAMVVMLRPGGEGHGSMTGMQPMPAAGPPLLAAVLAVTLLCGAVAEVAGPARMAATTRSRVALLGEAGLALLMAAMLLGWV
jgi:uncharacterized protein DUF5134